MSRASRTGGAPSGRRGARFASEPRGGEQRPGVWVMFAREQLRRRQLLDDRPVVHDCDPVGDLRDHRKIVAHQEHAGAARAHQFLEQPQNIRLRADIERGGGLIGDDQRRRQDHGHGNGDALPLSAGQLVRQPVELDVAQAHSIEGLAGEPSRLGRAARYVQPHRLGDLIADADQGIERRHRLLEDHADATSADRLQLRLAHRVDRSVLEIHRPRHTRRVRQESHDGEGRHGFSRARLADQSEDLAARHLQADFMDHTSGADRHAERLDVEQRLACHQRPLPRPRPSPRRLRPSTSSTTAPPGNNASAGSSAVSDCASFSMRPQLGVGGCAPRPT